jgi:Protein of unknown function (DUF3096)
LDRALDGRCLLAQVRGNTCRGTIEVRPDEGRLLMMWLYDLALLAQGRSAELDINLTLNGIIALAAGVLILLMPKLLNYIVALYLIFVGLVDVFDIRL